MDLSPNDIRNFEFPNQMRGYDKDEVDSFLDQVASALEDLTQQNLKLSMEAESLNSQLSSLKQFEDTIKSAAIDARRNADQTVETAKREAEEMLTNARRDAEEMVDARTKSVDDIEGQITRLGLAKKSYLSKLRTLIQSHMDLIEEIDSGELTLLDEEIDTQGDIDVTDSTDVTTEQRESLANKPAAESETEEQVENQEIEASFEEPEVEEAPAESEEAPSETEDIRASEEIDESEPEMEPSVLTEITEDSPIDPELAAALENYKQGKAQEDPQDGPVASRPSVVETTARAEDIPPGFIAKEDDMSEEQPTDKVVVESEQGSVEPNSLNVDESDERRPLEPEQLVDELDQVAAKLDEKIVEANPS